jgi:hypothetical protein
MKTFKCLVALCGLILAAGCGRVTTIAEWQREVEQFVTIEGNGDLNVLRDTENASGRRIMAVHGSANPKSSTDVVGVVLGPRQVDNRLAYVFLLATVSKGTPQEIRVATLSRRGRELTWRLGPDDRAADNTYRRHHQKINPTRFAPGLPWPAREDDFVLDATATAVMVTERRSGARWELTTPSGTRR